MTQTGNGRPKQDMPIADEDLLTAAKGVLRNNDLGHMVTAAPKLYPHQWSWDAAFISIGLAHISIERAIAELRTIFEAQWSTGMIPHIVFSDARGYFPGPDVWETHNAAARPENVSSSGICQPPVHAIALARVLDLARARGGRDQGIAESFAEDMLPRLEHWHRWLSTARDPSGTGLVEIHHGWESGMDNSPRWDSAYSSVDITFPIELVRTDTQLVADTADRPTDREYYRYLQLVKEMASVNYRDDDVMGVVSFRVTDVFMTAILALAADETARIAESLGQNRVAETQRDIAQRARSGVIHSVEPMSGRCRDFDVIAEEYVDAETIASWSLVLCGGDDDLLRRQVTALAGPAWAGHPSLAFAVPPSVSPDNPTFQPRTYWRGPTWPVVNWLLVWALRRHGETEPADHWRDGTLSLLADGAFAEYYDPQTGLPAGSRNQSWTAATAIDWLTPARNG